MVEKVEYRVRPVVRYIVTRHAESDTGRTGNSTQKGEYPNFDMAYQVAYALCKHEHEQAGTPPGDMNFIYPNNAPLSLGGLQG